MIIDAKVTRSLCAQAKVELKHQLVRSVLGKVGDPRLEREISEQGLTSKMVPFSAALVGTTTSQVAKMVGFSERTLRNRLNEAKPLSRLGSSLLLHFLRTYAAVLELFEGDHESARRWLKTPAVALGNSKPIDLLDTLQGQEMVHDLAVALEHGVYV